MNFNADIDRISNVIHNYADGRFGELNHRHVEKWLSQFDNQDIIAFETANLIEKFYATENDFNIFIDNTHNYIYNNLALNDDVYILNLQDGKKSQSYLNNLLFSKYKINYGLNYPMGDFVYIDDFLFSGHTLKNGLSNFLDEMIKYISFSSVIYVLCLQYNKFYISKVIDEIFNKYRIKVEIIAFSDKFYTALNECLQPTNHTLTGRSSHRNGIYNYTNENLDKYGFSPRRRENNNYIIESNRTIYEKEMLMAGITIITSCRNPQPILKPLGYSLYGYGAGFTVFTHRNCPNTTPLAFWWGDPNAPPNHPLSQWYPLMQRTI